MEMSDGNSDGFAESLTIDGKLFQPADVGDGGSREYAGVLRLTGATADANSDGHNESLELRAVGYERIDADLDGTPEAERGFDLEVSAVDANSNGFPETAEMCLVAFAAVDKTDDGRAEAVQAGKGMAAHTGGTADRPPGERPGRGAPAAARGEDPKHG